MERKRTAYDVTMEPAVELYATLDDFCTELLRYIRKSGTTSYTSPAEDVRIEDPQRGVRTIHYNGWKHTVSNAESIKRTNNPFAAVESIINLGTALKTWWAKRVKNAPAPTTDIRSKALQTLELMRSGPAQEPNIGDVYHDILGGQVGGALMLYMNRETPFTELPSLASMFENGFERPNYVDDTILVAESNDTSGRGIAVPKHSSGFSVHRVRATRISDRDAAREAIGYDAEYSELDAERKPFGTALSNKEYPRVLVVGPLVIQRVRTSRQRANSETPETTEIDVSDDVRIEFDRAVTVDGDSFIPEKVTRATCYSGTQQQRVRFRPYASYAYHTIKGVF